MRKTLINRDRLIMAPKAAVANAVASVFDRLQSLPHEVQLLALAGAFVLMTEASALPAQDAFSAVSNLMVDERHSTRRDHRFAAMKQYLTDDLKGAL